MSRIWIDKSRILNNYLFYFQLKTIKLALQLSLYFISFAVRNNFFMINQTWYFLVCTKESQEISWTKFNQHTVF
jgi:hypothetical protein